MAGDEGCGSGSEASSAAAPSAAPSSLTLDVHTMTGGSFVLTADAKSSVDHLKKLVSRRLKVPKERICLLHRERQLRDGTLEDNGIIDGSKIILLPSVETGLLTQRAENSVMQALESLNDSQVNDFLSGKSPLNLTMRLGDHMMLIQLQLSTYPGGGVSSSTSSVGKSRISSHRKISRSSSSKTTEDSSSVARRTLVFSNKPKSPEVSQNIPGSSTTNPNPEAKVMSLKDVNGAEDLKSFLCKQDIETLQNAFEIFKSLAEMQEDIDKTDKNESSDSSKYSYEEENTSMDTSNFEDQSPIKSLSNLVSSPLKSSLPEKEDKPPPPKFVPLPSSLKSNLISNLLECKSSIDQPAECPVMSDPIAANLTSCLCSSLNPDYACDRDRHHQSRSDHSSEETFDDCCEDKRLSKPTSESADSSQEKSFLSTSSQTMPMSKLCKNRRLHHLLHKTSKSGGSQTSQSKPKAFMQSLVNKHIKKKIQQANNASSSSSEQKSEDIVTSDHHFEDALNEPSTSKAEESHSSLPPMSDTNSLVEASKNLTQTLKKLSKEVLTNKVDLANEETARPKIGQGAVIESMKHHGKGIYSGTFSGTLNPALQDRFGRPKRDISTIIHILNDLLCATPPQYRRGARITFEATHNAQPITRTKQRDFSHCDTEHGTDECDCNKCSSVATTCPYGECNGHYTDPVAPSPSAPEMATVCGCKRTDCDCADKSCSCDSEMEKSSSCRKCDSATALALDNSKTKCKLDQLRLVMQQKKQRREARKIKAAPYPTSANVTIGGQSDAITEEIETLA